MIEDEEKMTMADFFDFASSWQLQSSSCCFKPFFSRRGEG